MITTVPDAHATRPAVANRAVILAPMWSADTHAWVRVQRVTTALQCGRPFAAIGTDFE
jgi:hypothetical protein